MPKTLLPGDAAFDFDERLVIVIDPIEKRILKSNGLDCILSEEQWNKLQAYDDRFFHEGGAAHPTNFVELTVAYTVLQKHLENANHNKTKTEVQTPGYRWRWLAWGENEQGKSSGSTIRKSFETVPDNKLKFDELVIDDWFHLEEMDANCYWMRVGDAYITVFINGGQCEVQIERNEYE